MEDYIAGVHNAWLGERLGFAAFSSRAEAERDEVLAEKWRLLAKLEQVTGERMAKVLRAHGEEAEEEPFIDRESEAFQTYLTLSHVEVTGYMRERVLGALERFEHLLATAPESDLEEIQFLVDHELALLTFVDKEADGDADSLGGVQELLSF